MNYYQELRIISIYPLFQKNNDIVISLSLNAVNDSYHDVRVYSYFQHEKHMDTKNTFLKM